MSSRRAAPDVRQLAYFVAVAEELHFGRAASRLGMAQPPLSQQIRRLERDLGVTLLERRPRSVRLTRAGAVFLARARDVLAALELAVNDARRSARGGPSQVRLGVTGYARAVGLVQAAVGRLAAHPDVVVDTIEDCSAANVAGVRAGRLDAAFVSGRPASAAAPSLCAAVVHEEVMLLALPAGHRLAARRRVPIEELADEDMVHFPERLAPGLHADVVAACARAGVAPRVARLAAGYDEILGAVGRAAGCSLVPESARRGHPPNVTFRRLAGDPPRATISLVYRPDGGALVRALAARLGEGACDAARGRGAA